MDATETLAESIRRNPHKGLKVAPQYFPEGDFVTLFVSGGLFYADRVDDLVTVYRSEDTDQIIGCKIKSVNSILQNFSGFGVLIEDHTVSIGLLFFGAANDDERRDAYRELCAKLGKDAMNQRVQVPQLQAA